MQILALLALLNDARALDTAKVPPHTLAVDDGGTITPSGSLVLALVGNMRGSSPTLDNGRTAVSGVRDAIVKDITSAASAPKYVVLLGDEVRSSSVGEWSELATGAAALLDTKEVAKAADPEVDAIGPVDNPGLTTKRAATTVEATPDGLPAIVVAGDRDASGDAHYEGLGAAFPGLGVDIGYNRVATWYSFDVATDGVTWRFVALDSNKSLLGSRWTEETRWFAGALENGAYDHLVVLAHDPLYNLAGGGKNGPEMDPGGGMSELLKVVDEHAGIDKLRAVIAAGPNANQVFLPDGPFGVLFLDAGGGGAPADDLRRWGERKASTTAAGKVQLEPIFDLALMGQLTKKPGVTDEAIEIAQSHGSYEGLVGTYRSKDLPTFGWWEMSIKGGLMNLVFHGWGEDHGMAATYTVLYQHATGWVARKL